MPRFHRHVACSAVAPGNCVCHTYLRMHSCRRGLGDTQRKLWLVLFEETKPLFARFAWFTEIVWVCITCCDLNITTSCLVPSSVGRQTVVIHPFSSLSRPFTPIHENNIDQTSLFDINQVICTRTVALWVAAIQHLPHYVWQIFSGAMPPLPCSAVKGFSLLLLGVNTKFLEFHGCCCRNEVSEVIYEDLERTQ